MLTFFHGWRRKMGAATLAMACLFAAGWIRSQFVWDSFVCLPASGKTLIEAESIDGRVSLLINAADRPSRSKSYYEWKKNSPTTAAAPEDGFKCTRRFPRLQFAGCGYYLLDSGSGVSAGWQSMVEIELMSLMIPLTLLSAWLLLSKPKRKPTGDSSAAA